MGPGPGGGEPGSGCGPGSGSGAGPGCGIVILILSAMFAIYPTRRRGNAVTAVRSGYHRAAMVTAPLASDPLGLHPVGTVRASDDGWFERTLDDGNPRGAPNLRMDLRGGEF